MPACSFSTSSPSSGATLSSRFASRSRTASSPSRGPAPLHQFPARFMLLAAMNPCPCGHLGDSRHACRCPLPLVERYRSRVSGPLLDRIDLHVEVPPVRLRDLHDERSEGSEAVAARIAAARARQAARFPADHPMPVNASLEGSPLRTHCRARRRGPRPPRRRLRAPRPVGARADARPAGRPHDRRPRRSRDRPDGTCRRGDPVPQPRSPPGSPPLSPGLPTPICGNLCGDSG